MLFRSIGMQKQDMTRESVRRVFFWSMVIAGAFLFIYGFGGIPLLRVMTSDASVVEACRPFLPWLILMPPLGCAAFAWDGIYEGATASRPMRDAMVAAMVGFFALWFALKGLIPGTSEHPALALHFLMAAYFVHLLVRTVWLSVLYRRSVVERPFGLDQAI